MMPLDGGVISGQVSRFFSSFRQAQVRFPGHLPGLSQLVCQVMIKAPDIVLAHFPEDALSSLSFDPHGKIFFFCAGYDDLFHIDARIDKVLGERDLQLILLGVRTYPQRRRFFRIDADVVLRYWPLESIEHAPTGPQQKRVNLSAVGLRFETAQFLRNVEAVGLEMHLGGESGVVHCAGRVVRVGVLEERRLESVALDFIDIPPAEQEKIIRFCLNEQRRQIRHKVRVLDLWTV